MRVLRFGDGRRGSGGKQCKAYSNGCAIWRLCVVERNVRLLRVRAFSFVREPPRWTSNTLSRARIQCAHACPTTRSFRSATARELPPTRRVSLS